MPLTLNEIWNIPAYLRFCMLEAILTEAEETVRDHSDEADLRVQHLFAGLRELGNIDWSSVLEPLIAFDETLRKDPTGTYSKMDFETREMYRNRVAFMARNSDCTELQVAEHALDLARGCIAPALQGSAHTAALQPHRLLPGEPRRAAPGRAHQLPRPALLPHSLRNPRQCRRRLHHRHRAHHHLLHRC